MADGEDEAARAFEDLRAEVSLMRRAVERLMAERAEPSDTPDYVETLGIISRNLSATAQRIDAVVNSPALALTPKEFGRQVIAASYEARREDHRVVVAARQAMEEMATRIGRQLESHLMADEQRRRVLHVGLFGLVLGIILWATLAGPIARSLPVSWLLPERMAARTLRMPMWQGGQRLMRASSPRAFGGIIVSNQLAVTNRKTLDACSKRAIMARKTVHCTIEIKPER
jgi:hypothetical protein